MKTIAPWNIQPGMKTRFTYPGGLVKTHTVDHVVKRRSTFSPGYHWFVRFTDGDFALYHGKSGSLPPVKFHVYEH